MNPTDLLALLDTVKTKHGIDERHDWSNGSETYFNEMQKELVEVAEELSSGRRCYLEDELGDVFWDYLNLLYGLEKEGKISLANVFKRSQAKYAERIEGIQQDRSWSEIKALQKQRLAEEHSKAELD